MVSHRVVLADLRRVVGNEHAREASQDDQVDGIQPSLAVEPESSEQISDILKLASSVGAKVGARGSGTKLGWGAPPERVDLLMSTARLDRVVEHSAGDLVVTSEAGVRLSTLQAHLAASGQMLALDPPSEQGTLGGIVATDASGPMRLRYGTVRDLLIGVTVVLADGTVARAGGKVVKNVAGYDLAKLYTGSLGTLGIVTQVTFRLHPLPTTTGTVLVECSDIKAAGAFISQFRSSSLLPNAVEVEWSSNERDGMVAILFGGIEQGVAAQVDVARRLASEYGQTRTLQAEEEGPAWKGLRSLPWAAGSGELGLKIGCPISQTFPIIETVAATAKAVGVRALVRGRAASGVLLVGITPAEPKQHSALLGRLRESVGARGGTAVVLEAATELKRSMDIWGPVGDALPLMHRVKHQFDPKRLLNPGRFVGGI